MHICLKGQQLSSSHLCPIENFMTYYASVISPDNAYSDFFTEILKK